MTFQFTLSNHSKTNPDTIADFFEKQNFAQADFKNGKSIYVSNYYEGESTSVKLKPRADYTTFYNSSSNGAVLVFEYIFENDTLKYEFYSPIWLFGIWIWKLDFKENPSLIFKYLKKGYSVQQKFSKYLSQQNK